MQPSLLTTFASRLSPGCVFYLSTDCEHVAAHMKQQFETFNAIATAAGSESTSTSDSCNEYCKSHFRQIMSMEEYMVLVGRGVMFPPPLDMPSTNPNPNLATGDVEVAVEGVAAGSRSGCISTKHAGDGWLVNGCFKFNPLVRLFCYVTSYRGMMMYVVWCLFRVCHQKENMCAKRNGVACGGLSSC